MWIYLVLFIFSSLNFKSTNGFKCNQFNTTNKHVFNTKTNYNSSLSYFNASTLDNLQQSISELATNTCTVDQLYLLSRHSTRNPNVNRINFFGRLASKLRQSLFDEFERDDERTSCEYYLFYHLYKWSLRYDVDEADLVVKIGDEITREMGKRYSRAFGSILFGSPIRAGVTKLKRTVQTLEAFIEGFEKRPIKYTTQVMPSLEIHKPDKRDIPSEPDELIERYKKSNRMQALQESISERLGLDVTLTLKEISNLHQFCAFDYEIHNVPFWCNFFKDDELDAYDFLLDATMYRQLHSPYLKSFHNQSAILFREIRNFFIEPKEKVFLGFSHSEVLKVILAELRLFEGGMHLTDDFEEAFDKSSEREWRASRILPFNSNLAFVKYNCINPVSNKTISKILTLHQEQPIKIGTCDSFLCPMSTFLRYIYPLHSSLGGINQQTDSPSNLNYEQ